MDSYIVKSVTKLGLMPYFLKYTKQKHIVLVDSVSSINFDLARLADKNWPIR